MVKLKEICYAYDSSRMICDHVTGVFPDNTFSIVLGANGSGKSTLMKLMSGIFEPNSGEVWVNGESVHRMKHRERATLIGYLPQQFTTVFPFSVREILLTGRVAFSNWLPSEEDYERVEEVVKELNLQHILEKKFPEISGGEQQLVMIGRILVQKPQVIVLDEPTNHLDVYQQHYVLHKLRSLASSGYAIIGVLHNPTLAYQYAANVCFFKEGKLDAKGHAVPDLERLKDVYGLGFERVEIDGCQTVLPKTYSCDIDDHMSENYTLSKKFI